MLWFVPDDRRAAVALVERLLAAELEREALDRERLGPRREPFALLVPLLDREPLALVLLREVVLARFRVAPLLLVSAILGLLSP